MQVDNTIAEIVVEIQKRTKAKYNVDVTFDEVVEMLDIQFTATAFGFARNIPIYWKGFLKFIWTNRRERAKYKKELFGKVLDENNNLTDKERKYYHYLARVNAHTLYKDLEKLGVNSKALSGEEVKVLPSNSIHFTNFKPLTKNRKR
jgi:hypothetical protein